jgi:hypothetical protein
VPGVVVRTCTPRTWSHVEFPVWAVEQDPVSENLKAKIVHMRTSNTLPYILNSMVNCYHISQDNLSVKRS